MKPLPACTPHTPPHRPCFCLCTQRDGPRPALGPRGSPALPGEVHLNITGRANGRGGGSRRKPGHIGHLGVGRGRCRPLRTTRHQKGGHHRGKGPVQDAAAVLTTTGTLPPHGPVVRPAEACWHQGSGTAVVASWGMPRGRPLSPCCTMAPASPRSARAATRKGQPAAPCPAPTHRAEPEDSANKPASDQDPPPAPPPPQWHWVSIQPAQAQRTTPCARRTRRPSLDVSQTRARDWS